MHKNRLGMSVLFLQGGRHVFATGMILVRRKIYTITRIEPDFAEITTKGIPYCFDNRTGKLNIWNLSLFMDGAETKIRKQEIFMNSPVICDKTTSIVMIKIVLKISPKAYELNFMNNMDLKLTKQLAVVGDKSYSVISTLKNDRSDHLVERYAKYGRIYNESRQSVVNSTELKDAFLGLKNKDLPLELRKTELPSKPLDCLHWNTRIRYSDLDSNMHANQSLYIKSCIDCVTHASKNDKLVHFNGDMIWYPISYLSINYLGESFANDKLLVEMWQDTHNISLFNFYVSRGSKKLAFIACTFGLNKINE